MKALETLETINLIESAMAKLSAERRICQSIKEGNDSWSESDCEYLIEAVEMLEQVLNTTKAKAELLRGYVGQVVELSYSHYGQKYNIVTSIRSVSDELYTHGHIYDKDNKRMTCGGGCTAIGSITSIKLASPKLQQIWFDEYNKFHKEIISEKGYDSCEEAIQISIKID